MVDPGRIIEWSAAAIFCSDSPPTTHCPSLPAACPRRCLPLTLFLWDFYTCAKWIRPDFAPTTTYDAQ